MRGGRSGANSGGLLTGAPVGGGSGAAGCGRSSASRRPVDANDRRRVRAVSTSVTGSRRGVGAVVVRRLGVSIVVDGDGFTGWPPAEDDRVDAERRALQHNHREADPFDGGRRLDDPLATPTRCTEHNAQPGRFGVGPSRRAAGRQRSPRSSSCRRPDPRSHTAAHRPPAGHRHGAGGRRPGNWSPTSGSFVHHRPKLGRASETGPTGAGRPASLIPELRNTQRVAATVDDAIGTLTASPELLDAVARLLRLQDDPADLSVLAPLVEREIMWRLLTGSLGAGIAQIGLPHSGQAQVARNIAWLRDNLATASSVAKLADIARMSTPTFHRHFRRITGMAPMQFHKHLRLQEARSLLLAESVTVTAVAHAVGYSSPTQFSREYRRLFGQSPGQDTDRLWQASPAGSRPLRREY